MAITLSDYIYNCYRSRHGSYTNFRNIGWEPRNFSLSTPFVKYIKIDLTKDTIEVPCIYKYFVASALHFNKFNPTRASNILYIPMFSMCDDSVESRSSNPLLKKFLYDSRGEHNLVRKKGSGTTYLGGEGIILYDDYTPLIMFTLEIKKSESEGLYVPMKQIVRINPVIYNKDDILAKYIRTKFLAKVLNMKLPPELLALNSWYTRKYRLLNSAGILTTTVVDYDFRVVIEDFSDFFYTPTAPNVNFNSDSINEALLKDSDFIQLMEE